MKKLAYSIESQKVIRGKTVCHEGEESTKFVLIFEGVFERTKVLREIDETPAVDSGAIH
jgi:hypothetical protein